MLLIIKNIVVLILVLVEHTLGGLLKVSTCALL